MFRSTNRALTSEAPRRGVLCILFLDDSRGPAALRLDLVITTRNHACEQ